MMNLQASFKKGCTAMMALSFVTLISCGEAETSTEDNMEDTSALTTNVGEGNGTMAEAVLSGTQPDTTVSGSVRFNEENGRVKMMLDITVPKKANQSVAVHIHEHGDCGDSGKEAHGHWNPTGVNHGKWGAEPFHLGDIGNVMLNAEGKGTMELDTDLWAISGSDTTKNILNKAIIVHSGTDDYTSQPAGNAGSRIGCGVIKQ